MPKLRSGTIAGHRRAVHEAVMQSTAALVASHGLRGVTMSRIAKAAGIGRATLYKHFPDLETILTTWHQNQVERHLTALQAAALTPHGSLDRLHAVLAAYARIVRRSGDHDSELSAFLHRDRHVAAAKHRLTALLADVIRDAQGAGPVRSDAPPGELAEWCLNALAAARDVPSSAAAERLIRVTLDGLMADSPDSPRT